MNSRTWKISSAGSKGTDHECFGFLHPSGKHNGNSSPKGAAVVRGIVFPSDRCALEQNIRSPAGKSRTPHAVYTPVIYCQCIFRQLKILSLGHVGEIYSRYLFVLFEP